eukprot:m51a1_g11963 hypothetical protein (633) ;mRNA; r:801899-803797
MNTWLGLVHCARLRPRPGHTSEWGAPSVEFSEADWTDKEYCDEAATLKNALSADPSFSAFLSDLEDVYDQSRPWEAALNLFALPGSKFACSLNAALSRGGPELAAASRVAQSVCLSLSHLPAFSGTAFRVAPVSSRGGIDLPKPGTRVFFPSFVSASSDEQSAIECASKACSEGRGCVLYQIGCRGVCSGAWVFGELGVRSCPKSEVLLEPGVEFDVLSLSYVGSCAVVTLSRTWTPAPFTSEDALEPMAVETSLPVDVLLREAIKAVDEERWPEAVALLVATHSVARGSATGMAAALIIAGLRRSRPSFFGERDPTFEEVLSSARDGAQEGRMAECTRILVKFHRSPAAAWAAGLMQSLVATPPIHKDAAGLFRRASEGGCVAASALLGVLMVRGEGLPPDPEAGVELLRKAAASGDAMAVVVLSRCLRRAEGMQRDAEEAARLAGLAAAQGSAIGLGLLGLSYAIGDGVIVDKHLSEHLFSLAAALGDAQAQYNLAQVVRKSDPARAIQLLQTSAKQGLATAQCGLALAYSTGDGVKEDVAEALRLWRQASMQGNTVAQYNLGMCLEKGRGCRKDEVEAVRWYKVASALGHKKATLQLALCYASGTGVKRDVKEAEHLRQLANTQGRKAR